MEVSDGNNFQKYKEEPAMSKKATPTTKEALLTTTGRWWVLIWLEREMESEEWVLV